jgi:hypothetical protein
MGQHIELGLDTFGDIQADGGGQVLTHAQVIRNVIDESVLADQVGVYCIGLGEHHRPDFAISSSEVLLAAIAARTTRIHWPRRSPCFRPIILFEFFNVSRL